MHWTCACINFEKKRFEYYDSLHGRNPSLLRLLRDYIRDESMHKLKVEFDFSGIPSPR
jgi:sentrin-specific protease 1